MSIILPESPSYRDLHLLAMADDPSSLEGLATFLQTELPTLPAWKKARYHPHPPLAPGESSSSPTLPLCNSADPSSFQESLCTSTSLAPSNPDPPGPETDLSLQPCPHTPCPRLILTLLELSASSSQTQKWTYLWDTFLSPLEYRSIPWSSISSAAESGSMALAHAFQARDPSWIHRTTPLPTRFFHGTEAEWQVQAETVFGVAVRSDQWGFVRYMQKCGFMLSEGNACGDREVERIVGGVGSDHKVLERLKGLQRLGARMGGNRVKEIARKMNRDREVLDFLESVEKETVDGDTTHHS